MKIVYLYRLFPNIINISNSLKKFIGGTDLLKNKSSSNYKKKCFLRSFLHFFSKSLLLMKIVHFYGLFQNIKKTKS